LSQFEQCSISAGFTQLIDEAPSSSDVCGFRKLPPAASPQFRQKCASWTPAYHRDKIYKSLFTEKRQQHKKTQQYKHKYKQNQSSDQNTHSKEATNTESETKIMSCRSLPNAFIQHCPGLLILQYNCNTYYPNYMTRLKAPCCSALSFDTVTFSS